MNLDTRLGAAVENLREASLVDPNAALTRLRQLDRRRRTSRVASLAVALVVIVAGGTWVLSQPSHRNSPVEPPGRVHNGMLVGWSQSTGPVVVSGDPLPHPVLPGAPPYAHLNFSGDGSELLYVNRYSRLIAWDVAAGTTRVLAECPVRHCLAGASPDTASVALATMGEVLVQGAAGTHSIEVPGEAPGFPVWSPDGGHIAFATQHALYVVEADGTDLQQVARFADVAWLLFAPAWAPDGRSLVYLAARDVEPQPDGLPTNQGMTKQAYTVTVVDLTTGHRTQLAKAGACLCLGWPAPTVTWSPDGTTIAYAKTGSHPGIYLVPAHGGKPTILYASRIGTTLAWQPLNE